MKKLTLLILLITFLTGCGSSASVNLGNTSDIKTSVGSSDNSKNSSDSSQQPSNENTYKAVYTGENIDKPNYDRIPFMAIIENIKAARPQSGLSSADIVFETMAEGGIPRFIALFQSKSPKTIGPVRSDRPYFNEIAESFNLPFAHCGGYQAALDEITSRHLKSMNEMFNGKYYFRYKNRKAPHNLFTSADRMQDLISAKGYGITPSFNIEFDENYWNESSLSPANSIDIKFSGYYSTGYIWKDNCYYKTMNGRSISDRNSGKQLTAKNIVVQITNIVPIPGDHKDRVNIRLSGSGSGYVFSGGHYKKINWSKSGRKSQTELTDQKGNKIKLSPGNTYWEIIDKNSKVTIE